MVKFFGSQQGGSTGYPPGDPPPGPRCYCMENCDTTISINLKKELPPEAQSGVGEYGTTGMIRSININLQIKKTLECNDGPGYDTIEMDCFGAQTENTSAPGGSPTGAGMHEGSSNIRSSSHTSKVLGSTSTGVCNDIPECESLMDLTCDTVDEVGSCRGNCKISIKFARPRYAPGSPPPPPRAVKFKKQCGKKKHAGWWDSMREAGLTSEAEQGIVDLLENTTYFDNDDVINDQFPATEPHNETFGNDLAQDLANGGNDSSKAVCGIVEQIVKEECSDPNEGYVELCCNCEEEDK